MKNLKLIIATSMASVILCGSAMAACPSGFTRWALKNNTYSTLYKNDWKSGSDAPNHAYCDGSCYDLSAGATQYYCVKSDAGNWFYYNLSTTQYNDNTNKCGVSINKKGVVPSTWAGSDTITPCSITAADQGLCITG